jgi:uncharacterized protein YeaO (DUF488 family)
MVQNRVSSVASVEARIKTKRWNDPVEPDDGHRLLVCRYRPRGVRKDAETWDTWSPKLGPSRELHADYYGKHGPPIDWPEFRRRYLAEMKEQQLAITGLGARVVEGETITLLCSSACTDPELCHRSLLQKLVAAALSS